MTPVRVAALLGAGLVALIHAAALQPWTVDDAYITFRYADHILAGHGPVYNPGEWVEGFTSPLWLGLLALGGLVLPVQLVAKGAGALGAAGALWCTARMPRVPDAAGAVAVAWLGTGGMLSAWSLAGLETALAAALGLGVVASYLRERPRAVGVVGALATLTRPELALLVVAFGVGPRWKQTAGWSLAVVGPWLVARWWMYGWPLPNTFYAKVGLSWPQVQRGLEYLIDASGAVGGVGLAMLALPLVWSTLRESGHHAVVARLVGVLVLYVGYVVVVGGDALPAFRFLVPVLGLGALVLGLVAWSAGPRNGALLVGVALALNAWTVATHPELTVRITRGHVGRNGVEVGEFLRDHVPADTLLATNAAGSVPWASRLRTIDMLGLTNEHIAHRSMRRMGQGAPGHEKADGHYVLSRRPDLVLFGAARGSKRPIFGSDRQLARLPQFRTRYVFEQYWLPSGALLSVYRRRDFTPPGLPPPARVLPSERPR